MWLVTGIGRSGTTYFFHFLKENGIDVCHEGITKEGALGWPFFAPGLRDSHPGCDEDWDVVIHQVRSPLKCIASLGTLQECTLQQYESIVGIPEEGYKNDLHRWMWLWLRVNEHIDSYADYRFQIEHLESVYPSVLRILGYESEHVQFPEKTEKKSNTRPHGNLRWSELDAVDLDLSIEIGIQAHDYGYGIQAVKPMTL